MKRLRVLATVGVASAAAVFPVHAQDGMVIINANLINGTGSPVQPNQTLVIQDGRIVQIGVGLSYPSSMRVVDAAGRFVIPGLVDAHVHLATDPRGNDARSRVEARLAMALRAGVTSVRDMAGDARALRTLAQDARSGEILSPAIYYSAVFGGPDFFEDPRAQAASRGFTPGSAPWARAITAETQLPAVIAEARQSGVTGIKLYASLNSEVVSQVTAEAIAQGLQVWAHATVFPARPSDAVRAGVHSLSHAAYIVWEGATSANDWRQRQRGDYLNIPVASPAIQDVVEQMVRAGTILDATLWVNARQWAENADEEMPEALRWSAALVRKANASGVRVSAGTDDIGDPDNGGLPNIHEELKLLVKYAGLSPLEAITAATRNGAQAIGIGATHGTVQLGMAADIVILDRDPSIDIANTTSVHMVIKRGAVLSRS